MRWKHTEAGSIQKQGFYYYLLRARAREREKLEPDRDGSEDVQRETMMQMVCKRGQGAI